MTERLAYLLDLEDILLTDKKDPYFERFPTCGQVQLITYQDGSVGSKCPYGAFGTQTGNSMNVAWNSCRSCREYKPK